MTPALIDPRANYTPQGTQGDTYRYDVRFHHGIRRSRTPCARVRVHPPRVRRATRAREPLRARLASAPARAAGRDRGDSLVVRMSSNPNLDRENPDLEEKFAVIG